MKVDWEKRYTQLRTELEGDLGAAQDAAAVQCWAVVAEHMESAAAVCKRLSGAAQKLAEREGKS